MSIKPKGSKYDEALGAMKRAAEGDDEDAKKAKKALKLLEDDGESEEDKKKKEEEAAAAAKAAEEEEQKKKDEEANARALARQVSELTAKITERESKDAKAADDAARAALFAKRPDFSDAQRKTLANVSLDVLRDAVETWGRANATPHAAVNAQFATGTGGERRTGYVPVVSSDEQELLDRTAGATAAGPTAATQRANMLQMPRGLTPEKAAARLAELEKESA